MASDSNSTPQLPSQDELGLMLRKAGTIQKKVLLIINEYGLCSKDHIINELEEFSIDSDQVQHALKSLKKKEKIQSASRGWYRSGGTIGGGSEAWGWSDDRQLKWFSDAMYFHNVKGRIEGSSNGVEKWGSKWGSFQGSKSFTLDNSPGEVKLVRNYGTIQFYFACKRPGFTKSGLLECVAKLYEILIELSIPGIPVVRSFEARNSRKMQIKGLLGQHYRLDLVAGMVAKAYQDGEYLQTEIETTGISYSLSDLINTANSLRSNVESMTAQNTISSGVKQTHDMLSALQKDAALHRQYASTQLVSVVNYAKEAKESTKSTAQYMEYVDSRLFELTQDMGSLRREQTFDDVREGFTLLVEKVRSLENKITEHEEEQKSWRQLDNVARREEIEEYLKLGSSISEIAEFLDVNKSTISRFLMKLQSNEGVTPHWNTDQEVSESKNSESNRRVTPQDQPHSSKGVTPLKEVVDKFKIDLDKDSEDQQVLKVVRVLGSCSSDEVIEKLQYLIPGNVRRSLSRLKSKQKICSRKAGPNRLEYFVKNHDVPQGTDQTGDDN